MHVVRAIVVVLALAAAQGCDPALHFSGCVTDADGVPVAGATVTLDGDTVLTDNAGKFHGYHLGPGREQEHVIVRAKGYRDMDLLVADHCVKSLWVPFNECSKFEADVKLVPVSSPAAIPNGEGRH